MEFFYLFLIIAGIAVALAILYIIRSIVLWYFKIDKHIENQELIIKNQYRLLNLLMKVHNIEKPKETTEETKNEKE